ncbi:MAG: TIGR00289 family protein [Candidatus Diapherotrites archaeon]|nr:TIGR00289 family protein [Candidatus Diapherotrites archaeon]
MKLVALYSGGKDSTYAIWKALKEGHSIECLLTMLPERKDSYMFHVPNLNMAALGAEAMGFPLVQKKTAGEKEKELLDLEKALSQITKKYKTEGILSGAIASKYQKERVDKIAHNLGQESFAPLWSRNNIGLLEEMVSEGFKIIVVGVYADGLDEKWLGREIRKQEIAELKKLNEKFHISPLGEGGELETLVIDCPLFGKKIKILEAEKQWDGVRGEFEIKKAALEKK